jgi:apolipoprotein N-acyltransferase
LHRLGLYWLAVLCPAVLFLLWEQTTPKQAAWRGFLFTGGLFLAGTYWIYHSVHTIGGAPLVVTLFLIVAMIAILSSYATAFGYALQRWGATSGCCAGSCCCRQAGRFANGSAAGCSVAFRGSRSATASSTRACAATRP